jgi:hypothetical protein
MSQAQAGTSQDLVDQTVFGQKIKPCYKLPIPEASGNYTNHLNYHRSQIY